MELRLCLGWMLLLGLGNTQGPVFSETSTEKEKWPKLEVSNYLPFSCKPETLRSNVSSVSVDMLRPSDVKFVASIGIKRSSPIPNTVGVMEKLHRTEEPQELCLGVGEVLSDIIRFFNPTVLRPLCVPTRKMLSWTDAEYFWIQAIELVRTMKANVEVDFENDWKLINVFISNANECHLCPVHGQKGFVTSAMNNLKTTLEYLYQEVPRSFVNLVDLTDTLKSSALSNTWTWKSNKTESCRCSEETAQYKAFAQRSYQETWERVLASSKYNQDESFALVFQPIFYETDQSPLLMEPSLQDPTELGVHLWNEMLEPVGHKENPKSVRETKLVKCPSKEHPYLLTYRNSNYQPRLSLSYPALTFKQVPIKCPQKTPSWTLPSSVHTLKPADIKVVTAVGDSLTAASGIWYQPEDFNSASNEYQGFSWSSERGDEVLENAITLTNILRQFNSKLTGFSLSHGSKYSAGVSLKEAVSGVYSMDISNQVTEVIRKMKHDKRINFKNDWKLLTMFIGGDELCHSCTEELIFNPEKFQNNIQHALDILHKEVPRMIVNVVSPLEIINLRALYKETGNYCSQDQLMKLCPCVMKYDEGSKELVQVAKYTTKYQELVELLVDSGRYDTRDDFTVVLQPFFERFELPRTEDGLPDLSYFELDCFHFSQKTLSHVASALWNNMLEPVGQKSRQHNFTGDIVFTCPIQKQPYLRTSKNSNVGARLSCKDKKPSTTKPTSVNLLKPADINIIGAIGDSDVVGRGVGSMIGHLASYADEYRQLSFCIGGQDSLNTVRTVPNIFRQYNSYVGGFATAVGSQTSSQAGCNQANSKALSRELVEQGKLLITKLKHWGSNFWTDWKIITVMIGYSDLCQFCKNQSLFTAENFEKNVREGLDFLQANVPRAVVNLLLFIDPIVRRDAFLTHVTNCNYYDRRDCPCIYIPNKGSEDIFQLEQLATAYKNSLRNLVWSGRYDTRNDFTVVLQPLFESVIEPVDEDGLIDLYYLSPNCLDFNQISHGQFAVALWNNMFEELGKKTNILNIQLNTTIKCPGDGEVSPFVRTKGNSKYEYPELITDLEWGSEFLCELTENYIDTNSAHRLQPSNIKVVAGLGDWITTGWASSPFTYATPTSWRAISFSTGGHKNLDKQTTLPNILRNFNSELIGYSLGSWPELAGLNLAENDARVRDIPEQARKLVAMLEIHKDVNYNNDWKIITIFIGFNDLCDFCLSQDEGILEVYQESMSQTLNIFYKELPRVFINLVEIMDVVTFFDKRGGKCEEIPFQCPCFDTADEELRSQLQDLSRKFQRLVSQFSSSKDFDEREDFVVVSQPFFRRSDLPRNEDGTSDDSFFSDNCQSFSSRMQNEMSIALWNNMLQPSLWKSTVYDFRLSRTKLLCPSIDRPYFYTEKNSGGEFLFWILVALLLLLLLFLIIISMVLLLKKNLGGTGDQQGGLQKKPAEVKTNP